MESGAKRARVKIHGGRALARKCQGAERWACSLVVERRICNAEVVGSNPTGSTTFF